MGLFSCFSASPKRAPVPCQHQWTILDQDSTSHNPVVTDDDVKSDAESRDPCSSAPPVAVTVVPPEPRQPLSAQQAEILSALLPRISDCGTFIRLMSISHATSEYITSWCIAEEDHVPEGLAVYQHCHRCKACAVSLTDGPDTAIAAIIPTAAIVPNSEAPDADTLLTQQPPQQQPLTLPRCFPGEFVCNACGTSRTGFGRISRAAALHEHGLQESQVSRLRSVWIKPGGGGGRVQLVLERDVLALKADVEREFHVALEAAEAAMTEATVQTPLVPPTVEQYIVSEATEPTAVSGGGSSLSDDGARSLDQDADRHGHEEVPAPCVQPDPPAPITRPAELQAVHTMAAPVLLYDEQEAALQRLVAEICTRSAILADLLRSEIRSKARYELATPQAADYVAQAVHFALCRALLSVTAHEIERRLRPYVAAGVVASPTAGGNMATGGGGAFPPSDQYVCTTAEGHSPTAALRSPRGLNPAAPVFSNHALIERGLSAAVAHYERVKHQLLKDAVTVAKRSGGNAAAAAGGGGTSAGGRRPEALGLEAHRRCRAALVEFAHELGVKQADRMISALDECLRGAAMMGSSAASAALASVSPGRPKSARSSVLAPAAALPPWGRIPAAAAADLLAQRRSGGWNKSVVVVVKRNGGGEGLSPRGKVRHPEEPASSPVAGHGGSVGRGGKASSPLTKAPSSRAGQTAVPVRSRV